MPTAGTVIAISGVIVTVALTAVVVLGILVHGKRRVPAGRPRWRTASASVLACAPAGCWTWRSGASPRSSPPLCGG
jgi:hypothetical protein